MHLKLAFVCMPNVVVGQESVAKLPHAFDDGIPCYVKVDVTVTVNYDITKSLDIPPWNARERTKGLVALEVR